MTEVILNNIPVLAENRYTKSNSFVQTLINRVFIVGWIVAAIVYILSFVSIVTIVYNLKCFNYYQAKISNFTFRIANEGLKE